MNASTFAPDGVTDVAHAARRLIGGIVDRPILAFHARHDRAGAIEACGCWLLVAGQQTSNRIIEPQTN